MLPFALLERACGPQGAQDAPSDVVRGEVERGQGFKERAVWRVVRVRRVLLIVLERELHRQRVRRAVGEQEWRGQSGHPTGDLVRRSHGFLADLRDVNALQLLPKLVSSSRKSNGRASVEQSRFDATKTQGPGRPRRGGVCDRLVHARCLYRLYNARVRRRLDETPAKPVLSRGEGSFVGQRRGQAASRLLLRASVRKTLAPRLKARLE
ncbi:hypothetical protein BJY59DRAFT_423010 [Rhodotorula toruloides]